MTNEQLEELISEWHAALPGHPAHGVELHEWLEMSYEDYGRWVENSSYRPE
jgi:hypothetical protein